MVTILFAVVSIFVFRFRSRAALELRLVALQHQLTVLRRQRSGRPQLSSLDRLLWVLLYRIWPQVIDAMVLVKPATVSNAEPGFTRSEQLAALTIGGAFIKHSQTPSTSERKF
jgi:hypothetical protein